MLAAHNATFIANSVASITTQLSTHQAQNIRAVRNLENMGSQLEEHINVVGNTLQSASNNTIPRPMMSALKSTIRSCARETFKESLEKHYTELERSRNQARRTPPHHRNTQEETWDDFEPSVPQRVSTAMSLFPTEDHDETLVDDVLKSTGTGAETNNDAAEVCDNISVHKEYDTIFGRLHITVKAVFMYPASGGHDTSSMRNFQAILSFRPSSWLSRPAIWRVATQRTNTHSRNNFHIIPTFSPIVSHTSPIFQACQQGRVNEVKSMLATRQASVHDIDEWGRGLLHVCGDCSQVLKVSHFPYRWRQDQGTSHSSSI